MPKSYQFTEEQVAELEAAKKANKKKTIDKRPETLLMRAAKIKRSAVSAKTGFCKQYISDLTAIYHQKGLSAIVESHYVGNRRNMSFDEEKALLARFEEQAQKGRLVEISAVKAAYEEQAGHAIVCLSASRIPKSNVTRQTSKQRKPGGDRSLKKINIAVREEMVNFPQRKCA
ncbi:hypothetical protein FACS1894171_0590 [Clostridia bacterium]|nr:hypothetical protein FACS1894171_0590 [Clostridia bacterium]